jgi:hypothetical protein
MDNYAGDLLNFIEETDYIEPIKKSSLSSQITNEIKQFNNNILYKAPEKIKEIYYNYKKKLVNVIVDWIKNNGGHNTKFANSFRDWNINYPNTIV